MTPQRRRLVIFFTLILTLELEAPGVLAGKKPKHKRDYRNMPRSEKEMFGSKSLRCLVCKAVVEEFDAAITAVSPKKKVATGSFRLTASGERESRVVPYARSETHLHDLLDSICNEFEQYAQAKEKSTGRPTIVRILDKAGGMNMRFGEVDIIPDEDLNTRLKFYCEGIVEEQEEDFLELFSTPNQGITRELCLNRANICQDEESVLHGVERKEEL